MENLDIKNIAEKPAAEGDTIIGIDKNGVAKRVKLGEAASQAGLPIGTIVMWSGSVSAIPNDWAICDGRSVNGVTTVDLRGRFLVGYGQSGTGVSGDVWDTAYSTIGAKGGKNQVALAISEMPKHYHTVPKNSFTRGTGGSHTPVIEGPSTIPTGMRGGDPSDTSGREGSGLPHENRPPYYVIIFIQKIA